MCAAFMALVLGICVATVARGTVIGIDNFDYVDGTIDGNSGGTGWAWDNGSQTQTNPDGISVWGIGQSGGEINWGNREVSGGALITNDGGAVRAYGASANPAALQASGVVYYGVDYTPVGGQSWAGISGFDFDNERFFFGLTSGFFGITSWPSDNAGEVLTTMVPVDGQTYRLVTAIDYDGDQLRMWIDPTGADYDNGALDNSADVALAYTGGNWNNQVRLASGNQVIWDNLIVATTFESIPEPSTLVLLAMGGLVVLLRRR